MAHSKDEPAQNIQRSVLVLLLALTLVVVLTAAIFEGSSGLRNPAAADMQQVHPRYMAEEVVRARDRALMLGQEYLRRNQLKKAEAEFIRAHAYDKEHPEALQGLGNTFFRLGEPAQAERYFQQLRTLRPQEVSSYTSLAIAQLVQGHIDEALDTVRDGTRVTDEQEHGPFHLVSACLYQMRGDPERAAHFIRKAQDSLGANLPVFAMAGWAEPLRQHPLMQEILANAPPAQHAGEGTQTFLPNDAR